MSFLHLPIDMIKSELMICWLSSKFMLATTWPWVGSTFCSYTDFMLKPVLENLIIFTGCQRFGACSLLFTSTLLYWTSSCKHHVTDIQMKVINWQLHLFHSSLYTDLNLNINDLVLTTCCSVKPSFTEHQIVSTKLSLFKWRLYIKIPIYSSIHYTPGTWHFRQT